MHFPRVIKCCGFISQIYYEKDSTLKDSPMNYHPFDFNKSMSKDGRAHFTYVCTLLVAAVMCMSIAECVYVYACMYVYVACVRACVRVCVCVCGGRVCVCVCVYLHMLCVYIKVDRDAVPRVSLSIDTNLFPLPDINNNILPRSTHFISRSIS